MHSPPKATKLLTPLRPLATNWIDWRDGSWVQIRRKPPWLCDLWIIWVLFNMVKHFWEQWLLPAGSDGGRVQHHEQPCAAPPCPPSLPTQAKSSQPDSRIETFLVVESRLSTFVLFYFFGQSANTFYAFNMGCYHPIVFKWTKKCWCHFGFILKEVHQKEMHGLFWFVEHSTNQCHTSLIWRFHTKGGVIADQIWPADGCWMVSHSGHHGTGTREQTHLFLRLTRSVFISSSQIFHPPHGSWTRARASLILAGLTRVGLISSSQIF